jgi:16S rRNA (adenine1518-N6/adenine1519-N6)-dimethyltransferase
VVASIVGECSGAGGILEIGPGAGVLTERLQEIAPVTAIDVDPRVRAVLAESAPKADFRLLDVLDADLRELAEGLSRPRFAVGNLPYYISTPILRKFATAHDLFDRVVFMVQREVADRILAPHGDSARGALSVIVQRLYRTAKVCVVPPGAFYAPPKVASAVIRQEPTGNTLHPLTEEFLFAGFKQPRKTILNNLAAIVGREAAGEALTDSGIEAALRPSALTEAQWVSLALGLSSPTN